MGQKLRLCLVHANEPLAAAFRALGHEVLDLQPPAGAVLDLPAELARHGFVPDVVLQQEILAARTLLAGLERIAAVRAFWALDPHLNAFWHAPYARLFDLVFCTQRRNIPELARLGAPDVRHLPFYAPDTPFTPFAERRREAGFVGRLGPTRPARQWLVELMHTLLPGRFEALADISYEDMLEFTRTTRLVPNESIAGEVNFRLFEAAGHGCVVLAQDLGPEQAELFVPGREILVCADALELAEAVRMLTARPKLAEAMGRAAWERAQADHLAANRADAILAAIRSAAPAAAAGPEARCFLALALAGLFESGRLGAGGQTIAADLAGLTDQDARVLEARLRTGHALGDSAQTTEALARCEAVEVTPGDPDGLSLALACAMLALRQALDDPASAPAHLAESVRLSARAGVHAPPEPLALLLAWADAAEPLPDRAGFGFDAARHLPANAMECLFLAQALRPEHLPTLRAALERLSDRHGAEVLRLGLASSLSLQDPGDWRASLLSGLLSLLLFRLNQGLDELALAWRTASSQGQDEAFSAALAEADPAGRIRKALG